ncbi:hypothetical protein [Pseudonocardia spirodelae]|uniref:Uncharacterized protein n=1 Tax=Pseudonocardia spirodelae TaxID=3133431 RepID=A0ABU8T7N8_9PSEU
MSAHTQDPADAPDPAGEEFLTEQNTVERQAPGRTADEAGLEAGVLPTDPPLVGEDTTAPPPSDD